MGLRLTLFCIAVLVILWIIWDHNRKHPKVNHYKKQSKWYDNLLKFINKAKHKVNNKKKNKRIYNNVDINKADQQSISLNTNTNKSVESSKPVKPAEYLEQAYEEVGSAEKAQNNYKQNFREEIITLHVKAKENKTLDGVQLLQALLSVGCRFGEMNIFHRYENKNGSGSIIFSVASMVKPGNFNIDAMQDVQTPGITMFFATEKTKNNSAIYDLMLKTAYSLAKYLDAEILDETRALLTTEKVMAIKENLGAELEYNLI